MFLRNQFKGEGKWSMPVIPKVDLGLTPFDDQRLIGFDKIKTGKDEHYQRIVHFFLYDYKFEDIWTKPDKYIDVLKKYKAVLSPDYSMYIEMNPIMQLYNTFRNRWVGAYLAENGIKVIPTVSWGLENTFDFCFNGIEKGSTVAVSTYMVSEHGSHKDQKEFFLKGYNEMLKRIEPELIICYNTPFPEMEGNILFVDYDLSSWQHYSDDIGKSADMVFVEKYGAVTNNSVPKSFQRKQVYGYVMSECFKGMGSSEGGDWRPDPNKPDEARFLGEPNSIGSYQKRNGAIYMTKYDDKGKAERERHLTNHGNPKKHTNPHDHTVDWSNGRPKLIEQVDYKGDIPEFKGKTIMQTTLDIDEYNYSNRFKTLYDFTDSLNRGGEIQFDWNEKSYSLTPCANNEFAFCEAYKPETEIMCKDTNEVLELIVDGQKLREIITKVTVTERTI